MTLLDIYVLCLGLYLGFVYGLYLVFHSCSSVIWIIEFLILTFNWAEFTWLIFLLIMGYGLMLLWMPGFYFFISLFLSLFIYRCQTVNFTYLDARYFCIPINIFGLYCGIQQCYLETCWSFWVLFLIFFRWG